MRGRYLGGDTGWRDDVLASEHFYCWMLHQPRLITMLDEDRVDWLSRIRRSLPRANRTHVTRLTRELQRWLRGHEVPSLELLVFRGEPVRGRLVWIDAPFIWSHVARERQEAIRDDSIRSSFTADLLADGEREVRVHGTFSPRHLTCSSSNSELAGVRSHYVVGTVAVETRSEVELRPLAIADRFLGVLRDPWAKVEHQRVYPRQIDQFAHVNFDCEVTSDELHLLTDIPENEVKEALADMIGEPVRPKDWGGEQLDLWTTRLQVDGRQSSAAFLLKGPSAFRPMTIKVLGTSGDQIDRLADTAAELLVIQHCHQVTPRVEAMLRAYASDYRNPRRYMIIDGYDTFRILNASARL